MYLCVKSKAQQISTLASSGSATPNLNKTEFSKIAIIIPNQKAVLKFHNVTCSNFELIKHHQVENQALEMLRDTLLPKLMSGKIEVPVEG